MIRKNDTYVGDSIVSSEVFDLKNFIYSREENGKIVETRPMTVEEIRDCGPPPLDRVGSFATLLAVEGVLTVEDAANAVGLRPSDLENEAKAWFIAGGEI